MGMFNPFWFLRQAANTTVPVGLEPPTPSAEATGTDVPTCLSLPSADGVVWVIYASQTGVAEHLARETCKTLLEAGVATRLLGLDALDLATLEAADRVLFLVSTSGDGDPPDMADMFCREQMQAPARLARLRYGMLSLGDSYYDEFCAFGRRLQQWLRDSHARPLFATVEMDNEDDVALQRWQDCLGTMAWLRHDGGHLSA